MKKVCLVVLAFAGLLVAVGCSGDPEPLTIAEYASTVCPAWEGAEEQPETWGDAVRVTNDLRKEVDVTPPEELKEYHQSQIALLDALADFAEEQPSGDAMNPFAFIAAPQMMALGLAAEQVETNLEPEARRALIEHGCIDGG